jgi:hypothetical protein
MQGVIKTVVILILTAGQCLVDIMCFGNIIYIRVVVVTGVAFLQHGFRCCISATGMAFEQHPPHLEISAMCTTYTDVYVQIDVER